MAKVQVQSQDKTLCPPCLHAVRNSVYFVKAAALDLIRKKSRDSQMFLDLLLFFSII